MSISRCLQAIARDISKGRLDEKQELAAYFSGMTASIVKKRRINSPSITRGQQKLIKTKHKNRKEGGEENQLQTIETVGQDLEYG